MNPFTKALNEALGKPAKSKAKAAPDDDGVYPEPGEWVYEKARGMPPIHRPEPIPAGPIDIEDVKHHVRHDGLGHCLYSLIPYERIEDERLRELWRIARKGMQKVLEHLEDH